VNLFVSSEVDWEEKGIRIQQDASLTSRHETRLRILSAKPTQLAVRIREPYWTDGKMSVTLNGKPANATRAGGYLVVDRTWANADDLRAALPMDLHAHPMPDDNTLQAVMYGPWVLAGDLGRAGLTEAMRTGGDNPPEMPKPAAAPEFVAESNDPRSWIEPATKAALTFRTKGQNPDVTMMPFSRIIDQRYGVYWRVTEKQG
jgi:DUF1680 family protein